MILQIPYHQFRIWAMLFGIGVRRYMDPDRPLLPKSLNPQANLHRSVSDIARPKFISYPEIAPV
jgi:hypothetical protein